jgi:hypothetical protein
VISDDKQLLDTYVIRDNVQLSVKSHNRLVGRLHMLGSFSETENTALKNELFEILKRYISPTTSPFFTDSNISYSIADIPNMISELLSVNASQSFRFNIILRKEIKTINLS